MIGAIAGDVVGSVHERAGTKHTDFPLFVEESRWTDDTVLTLATAESCTGGLVAHRVTVPFAAAALTTAYFALTRGAGDETPAATT